MRIFKIFPCLLLILLVALGPGVVSGAWAEEDPSSYARPVSVGGDYNYPPYEYSYNFV